MTGGIQKKKRLTGSSRAVTAKTLPSKKKKKATKVLKVSPPKGY